MTHSPEVLMWLDCGEHGILHLARSTPKYFVAKEPRDIPPCKAVYCVSVGGELLKRVVDIGGVSKGERKVMMR